MQIIWGSIRAPFQFFTTHWRYKSQWSHFMGGGWYLGAGFLDLTSLTGDIAWDSSLLVSKRGAADRLTELFVCCLRQSGVAGVESTFLWDFPMWIFKPFSDLKLLSQWSHLKVFSEVGAMSFFLRSSSLLLASRLRVDGVFFFFWGIEASFPLVSTVQINPSWDICIKVSNIPCYPSWFLLHPGSPTSLNLTIEYIWIHLSLIVVRLTRIIRQPPRYLPRCCSHCISKARRFFIPNLCDIWIELKFDSK